MLTRLYVDNYRCLVNFEMHVPKVAVLLGANGSGKSSVWEVLVGIQQVIARGHAPAAAFPIDTLTAWQAGRDRQRFEVDVEGPQGLYAYQLALTHERERRRARVVQESVSLAGKLLYRSADGIVSLAGDRPEPTTFSFDSERAFLGILDPPKSHPLRWFVDWVRGMRLVQPDPVSVETFSDREADTLETNGENFASYYRGVQLNEPESAARAMAELRGVLPGFETLRLEVAGDARALKARFRSDGGAEYEVAFGQLSHGERAAVVLYVLLHASRGSSLLFLDEPDNYLALPEIQPWVAQLLHRVEEGGVQALVISHHPTVIDYLAPVEAMHFHREDGGPTRLTKMETDLATGLTTSEWWAQGLTDAP
ncbi:MAG: AAA family ATPase [Deltaproteobacteria bacterium]|nr:AAA family ATPase [Deltaproteobacteria bacterium]